MVFSYLPYSKGIHMCKRDKCQIQDVISGTSGGGGLAKGVNTRLDPHLQCSLSWGKESKAKGTKCRDLTVLNVPWYSLSFMLFCMS